MPLLLFHGDDLVSSREALFQNLASLKSQDILPRYLDPASLTVASLELAIGTTSLFSREALVIESLLARPRSRALTDCLTFLASYRGDKPLLLWEGKTLSPAALKKFSGATIKHFRTPPVIFRFLDSLTPTSATRSLPLLQQAVTQGGEGFVFLMLARRVSDLLVAQSGDPTALFPFARSRLLTQAKSWPENTLLSLHRQLTEFDCLLKTGATLLSYTDFLDITLASLLC